MEQDAVVKTTPGPWLSLSPLQTTCVCTTNASDQGAKPSSLSCTEMSCHYMIAMRVCGTIVLSGGKTSHENISDDQSSSPVNKPEPSRATSVPAPQLEVPSASNGAVSEFYLLTLVPTLLVLNPRPALSKEAKVMIPCTTSWTRK